MKEVITMKKQTKIPMKFTPEELGQINKALFSRHYVLENHLEAAKKFPESKFITAGVAEDEAMLPVVDALIEKIDHIAHDLDIEDGRMVRGLAPLSDKEG